MKNDYYNGPCSRDCPDRTPGCHGTCPRYKEWVAKREAEKIVRAAYKERYALTHAAVKAMWKSTRRDNSSTYKKFSQ